MQSASIPSNQIFEVDGALATLVSLLSSNSPNVAESAASVLGRCCDSHQSQDTLVHAGAVFPLIHLLKGNGHRGQQAAALAALAALTDDNSSSCAEVLKYQGVIPEIISFAKSAVQPRMRFTACVCLVHLSPYIPPAPATLTFDGDDADVDDREIRVIYPPRLRSAADFESSYLLAVYPPSSPQFERDNSGKIIGIEPAPNKLLSRDMVEDAVLPVLVKLLSEPEVGPEVAPVFITLANGDATLQKAAVDADAISRLVALLKSPEVGEMGRKNALLGLKMLTENEEKHRVQLVDCGALPLVASALTDASPAVRGAACCCMRSLSRSTRLLRCSLGSLTDVAAPLLELSRSDDVAIATEAAATLANMAVDYSSLKEQVLQLQGIARFAELTGSIHRQLRLYGVWGLSSSVSSSSAEIKAAVMKAVPWSTVAALLQDEDGEVKEKTLLLLRNLVNRDRASPSSAAISVSDWSQGQLLTSVLQAIESELGDNSNPQQAKHVEQALYVLVNIACGGGSDKDAVLSTGWIPIISAALEHPAAKVREAAVWTVINLTYPQEGDAAGTERRRGELRRIGVGEQLRVRATDTNLNVRERAATALEQLVGPRGGGVDEGEGSGMVEEEGRDWLQEVLEGEEGGDEGDDDDDDIDEDMEEPPEGSLDIESVW